MEGVAPKNPKQQGYHPLQDQITYSMERKYPPQEEHSPTERYENVTPFYPSGQEQLNYPGIQAVPVTQQETSNIVAVQSQPTSMSANTVIHPTKDHYLTLSIVLTFLCLFVGNLHILLCTIPAIILAIMARHAETHGDLKGAQSKAQVALYLNIVSFVVGMMVINIFVMMTAKQIAATARHYKHGCNDNSQNSSYT